MPKQFDTDIVQQLADVEEIYIETRASTGQVHRVIIWVVVDNNNVYIRSVRGSSARWYIELTTNSEGAIVVDGQDLAVRVFPITSDTIRAHVSDEYLRKYHDSPYAGSMVRPEILDTTLLLEPA